MKKCSEVMTENPTCCLPSEAVSRVAQLMKDENVGSIPVVENPQTKILAGIVTDRDLAVKVVAGGWDANSTRVADVMTSQVITCHVDDPIDEALDTMADHQIRRLPVVDDNYKIVGIISQADVATRVDKPKETGKMVKEISQPD